MAARSDTSAIVSWTLTSPTSTASLPADVVLEIVLYLSFQDALHLSLASKTVHAIVPLRITIVVCKHAGHILALHDYLNPRDVSEKSLAKERAARLRSLTLRPLSTESPDVTEETGYSKQLLHTFMKAVYKARNFLVSLDIGEASSCHALTKRLDRFSSLTQLRLNDIREPEDTVEHISYPAGLRELYLCGTVYSDGLAVGAFHVLLKSIVAHNLSVLDTITFEDIDFLLPYGQEDECPSIPSVRTLCVINAHLNVLAPDIARIFPNLQHMMAKNAWKEDFFWQEDSGDMYKTNPNWCCLESLFVIDPPDYGHFPWEPTRLRYVLTSPTPTPDQFDTLNVLELHYTIPIHGLILRIHKENFDINDHTCCAPKLFLLELESTMGVDYHQVLEELNHPKRNGKIHKDCYRNCPVVCLTILGKVLTPQSPSSDMDVDDDLDAAGALADGGILQKVVRAAFTNIPSLRYFAVAQREISREDWREDYAGQNRAPWRWWRATRDTDHNGTVVDITEIPVWKGELVRTFLRTADTKALEAWNGEV